MAETWRERLEQIAGEVAEAKARRAALFAQAIEAGLTYRQVGEAAGLSASQVHVIVGKRAQKVSLDDPASVGEGDEAGAS